MNETINYFQKTNPKVIEFLHVFFDKTNIYMIT